MIMDNNLVFSDTQAISNTGTTDSTNIVDAGAARDLGPGHPIWVNVDCTVAATSGGSATVYAQLVADTSPTFTANPEILGQTPTWPVASLVAGFRLGVFSIPYEPNPNRYYKVQYVVGAAALTTGGFTAFLSDSAPQQVYYPSGFDASHI
jgi:hypothetical protein